MHHISKNWERVFDFQYKVVTGQCESNARQYNLMQSDRKGREEKGWDSIQHIAKQYGHWKYINALILC